VGATARASRAGPLDHVRGSLGTATYVGLTDRRLVIATQNLRRSGSAALADIRSGTRAKYRRDALGRPIVSILPTDDLMRAMFGHAGTRLTFGYRDSEKWRLTCDAVGAVQDR
jgi:hypothetical protein